MSYIFKKYIFVNLFLINLITRILFLWYLGFNNNYDLQKDSYWLTELGFKVISTGNLDMDIKRFIASPVFPLIVAFFKFIFKENWDSFLIIFQLLFSSITSIAIFKIGELIYNQQAGIISSMLYAVFPLTMIYVGTFSQENLFQNLFIWSFLFLLISLYKKDIRFTCISALFYSLSYLTKSHILLFLPFIILLYFLYNVKRIGFTLLNLLIYIAICVFVTLPWALYNYRIHGIFVISSNGVGYQFYLGNTNAGFVSIVDVPPIGSDEFYKVIDINAEAGYFNGSENRYNYLLSLPQKEKQINFFYEAIDWIKNNPKKFFLLKIYSIFFFLIPGVSWRHYDFFTWLSTFLVSLPIYIMSYYTMFFKLRHLFKRLLPFIFLFFTMFIFSFIFYVQNRFRTITLEPFYLVLSSIFISDLLSNGRFKSIDST